MLRSSFRSPSGSQRNENHPLFPPASIFFEKDWDTKNQKAKKSHPNSVRLNNLIAHNLAEANDKLLELENDTTSSVSAKHIRKHIKRTAKDKSFFRLADQYMKQLEASKKHNRVSAEKPHLKHF